MNNSSEKDEEKFAQISSERKEKEFKDISSPSPSPSHPNIGRVEHFDHQKKKIIKSFDQKRKRISSKVFSSSIPHWSKSSIFSSFLQESISQILATSLPSLDQFNTEERREEHLNNTKIIQSKIDVALPFSHWHISIQWTKISEILRSFDEWFSSETFELLKIFVTKGKIVINHWRIRDLFNIHLWMNNARIWKSNQIGIRKRKIFSSLIFNSDNVNENQSIIIFSNRNDHQIKTTLKKISSRSFQHHQQWNWSDSQPIETILSSLRWNNVFVQLKSDEDPIRTIRNPFDHFTWRRNTWRNYWEYHRTDAKQRHLCFIHLYRSLHTSQAIAEGRFHFKWQWTTNTLEDWNNSHQSIFLSHDVFVLNMCFTVNIPNDLFFYLCHSRPFNRHESCLFCHNYCYWTERSIEIRMEETMRSNQVVSSFFSNQSNFSTNDKSIHD